MAKNFSNSINQAAKGGGLSSLIPTEETEAPLQKVAETAAHNIQEKIKVGRKPRTDKDNKKVSAAEKGTKPGEMRKTYLVNIDLAEQIEAIAHWDRKSIKEIVNKAFEKLINNYASESANKQYVLSNNKIKPIPED